MKYKNTLFIFKRLGSTREVYEDLVEKRGEEKKIVGMLVYADCGGRMMYDKDCGVAVLPVQVSNNP